MKRLLATAAILVGSFLLLANGTQAQDFGELGLAIKPALTEVIGEPGKTTSTDVVIENISAEPVAVLIGSRSLLPNDPEIDQSKRANFDASTWIEPKTDSILLDRGEQKKVTVDVVVPIDAGPGGHYALVTYRTINDTIDSSASGTNANPELTTSLFITTPGLIDEKADISLTQPSRFFLDKNVPIKAAFANSGNIHLLPATEVEIINDNDEVIDVVRIPPELTLPNTIKTLNEEWNPGSRIGRFRLRTKVSYGSPQQQVVIVSNSFLVLPSLPIVVFSGSLLIFTIVLAANFKRLPRVGARLLGQPIKVSTPAKPKLESSKKISVKTTALDELGADKNLANQPKVRKRTKTTPKAKKIEIREEKNTAKHRDYLDKIK